MAPKVCPICGGIRGRRHEKWCPKARRAAAWATLLGIGLVAFVALYGGWWWLYVPLPVVSGITWIVRTRTARREGAAGS